ncbi:MAG: mitochondrial fission ELM1 family protein [Gammaproteobacteria bacterium]|nr:MAG: mitochondrial fission ELM1 family protein [Gammaproteobacteria bacterium]
MQSSKTREETTLSGHQADGRDAADPAVWVVAGYRAGERTQLVALAEALRWPFEIKQLKYRKYDFLPGLLRIPSLVGIDERASAPLKAPWPEIVISAGMRNEPVCRWIRARSGGKTKLVHVGRPWAACGNFDLVVTTPQYRLPQRDNVLQNVGTLHRVNEASLAAAAEEWSQAFDDLPMPRIGLILGGNSGPYTLGPNAGRALGRLASAGAARRGGSLLISTSARTTSAATEALISAVECPHYVYRWSLDEESNPYLGILALSDSLIVTSDSVSMLSECCATGKPVFMFDLAAGQTHTRDFRISADLYRLLMRIGPRRLTRDLTLFHRKLLESGQATWVTNDPPARTVARGTDDVESAVARVRDLLRD